jgi:dihydroorotase
MTYDLIIKNGTLLTPNGRERKDVAVSEGKIVDIGNFSNSKAKEVIDAAGQFVLPGLVDTQVHFREPGNEHKENLEAGTKGAALGGVTGVFEMPNTKPSTTTPEALQDKLDRMKGRAWTNYAFYVGGTPEKGKDWHMLEDLPGCCGIKIFMGASTGDLLVAEDKAVEAILSKTKRRVAVHSEDNFRLEERFHIAKEGAHPRYHEVWRDKESAIRCTKRLINIARKTGAKVHVLHITTYEEMEFLATCRDVATVEALPQHLTFSSEDYETLGSRIQMNPPIRDAENRDKLWTAIDRGIVDAIASDHAPHTLEEKAKQYPESPSGMPGVQTIVPVLLNHANNGKITLERIVDMMASNLSRIWGVKNKGRIAMGYDADFTIVDMNREHTFTDEEMANVSGWTPYAGMKNKGMPTHTIIAGNIIMKNGELDESKQGMPKAFEFDV